MAQIANTGAEKAANTAKNATDDVAERSKRTVNQAAAVTREVTERAEDAARSSLHVVQRTVDAVGEGAPWTRPTRPYPKGVIRAAVRDHPGTRGHLARG